MVSMGLDVTIKVGPFSSDEKQVSIFDCTAKQRLVLVGGDFSNHFFFIDCRTGICGFWQRQNQI